MRVKVVVKRNTFLVYVHNSSMNGDRIPVGARFCAPVPNGRLAHPASCIVAEQSVCFSGLKRPECGVDHSPPSMYKVICISRLFITCLTFEIVLLFCLHVKMYCCVCGRGPWVTVRAANNVSFWRSEDLCRSLELFPDNFW